MKPRPITLMFLAGLATVTTWLPCPQAGAIEDRVAKDDCKAEVWRGLVDGTRTSFKSLGDCVSAANHGDAFTDPRFVEASLSGTSINFREIGMRAGEARTYRGYVGGVITAVCRPAFGGGELTTRTAHWGGFGYYSATADQFGQVIGSFPVYAGIQSPCRSIFEQVVYIVAIEDSVAFISDTRSWITYYILGGPEQ